MRAVLLVFTLFLVLGLEQGWSATKGLVKNFGFEDDGPGKGFFVAPSEWIGIGNTGVNPFDPVYGDQNARNPFADNGNPPQGEHVVYMQCSQVDAAEARLRQQIEGFETDKKYVLHFRYNRRYNSTGRGARLKVSLGEAILEDWFSVQPVAGLRQNGIYHRRLSPEFQPAAASMLLEFLMESELGAYDLRQLPPPANEVLRADAGILLDDVYFLEVGTNKLKSVRRSFVDRTRIIAEFESELDPEAAANLMNYQVTSGFGGINVESAFLRPDKKSVEIKTVLEVMESDYYLVTIGMIDASGKILPRANSVQPIQVNEYRPQEINTQVNGILDDFDGSMRNPKWVVVGTGGDVYRQSFGTLKVGSAEGGPNHLIHVGPYNSSRHEILAHLRIAEIGGVGGKAGLSVATGMDGHGVNLSLGEFRNSLFEKDGSGSQSAPFQWQPNAWYWMRLSHSVENGKSLVRGKLWKADGDTPEPESALWEYPAPGLEGFAGIQAGSAGGVSQFEVDWVLIRSENLPLIQVPPPGPFQVGLSLFKTAEGLLRIEWPGTESAFELETSMDLDPFGWTSVPYEEISGGGAEPFVYFPSEPAPAQFFRLRSW